MLGEDRRGVARKLGIGKFLVVEFLCEFSCSSSTYPQKTCPTTVVNRFHSTLSADLRRCKGADLNKRMTYKRMTY